MCGLCVSVMCGGVLCVSDLRGVRWLAYIGHAQAHLRLGGGGMFSMRGGICDAIGKRVVSVGRMRCTTLR